MEFYENIAGIYDEMTRFSDRFEKEKPVFQNLITKHNIKTALDVACGTGLHTILLNDLGVKCTGVDISTEMINRAKANAQNRGLDVSFYTLGMHELDANIHEKYDAVFCLGNSLPHLQDLDALNEAVSQFSAVLNKRGIVFLQILNYAKILKSKNRIINITYKGNKQFIRFYDFLEKKLLFNLLMIEKENEQIKHSLTSTLLVPFLPDDISGALKSKNLHDIQYFSDLQFRPFNLHNSGNLVVTAVKK